MYAARAMAAPRSCFVQALLDTPSPLPHLTRHGDGAGGHVTDVRSTARPRDAPPARPSARGTLSLYKKPKLVVVVPYRVRLDTSTAPPRPITDARESTPCTCTDRAPPLRTCHAARHVRTTQETLSTAAFWRSWLGWSTSCPSSPPTSSAQPPWRPRRRQRRPRPPPPWPYRTGRRAHLVVHAVVSTGVRVVEASSLVEPSRS